MLLLLVNLSKLLNVLKSFPSLLLLTIELSILGRSSYDIALGVGLIEKQRRENDGSFCCFFSRLGLLLLDAETIERGA